MTYEFSTGSADLDALLEELRAGDNVVLLTPKQSHYVPFCAAALGWAGADPTRVVYARSAGLLDEEVGRFPGVRVLDLALLAGSEDPLGALLEETGRIGRGVYYLFEDLCSFSPWFVPKDRPDQLFTTVCPHLFRLDTVAYWSLVRGDYEAASLAEIKDCTQVFVQLERHEAGLVMTPLKVWGRYSEAMFRPHLVMLEGGHLKLRPLADPKCDAETYAGVLEDKNRELAEIRDALDRSNQALQQRNSELGALNRRLSQEGHRYQSLHRSLDDLLQLLQAGQAITASLVMAQVRQAVVSAAVKLLDTEVCRLVLCSGRGAQTVVENGMTSDWQVRFSSAETAATRAQVHDSLAPRSLTLDGSTDARTVSVAIAPIAPWGSCLGTLELGTVGKSLDTEGARRVLGQLASVAGIALENARLYRDVEVQGKQLQSYLESYISSEEQESRRLALDLHDGLVQMVVASYQHLQSAQAWRSRDPELEAKELVAGTRLLRESIHEARRLIGQLRPPGLDDFGLAHALRMHTAQLAQEAGWDLSCEVDPSWPSLPPALETALFRIVQEATTNARKHAEAASVEISLSVAGDRLLVTVRDWGGGFDIEEAPIVPESGLHLGLIGIRERARLWGGECRIDSEIGKGTEIRVAIPKPTAEGVPSD